MESSELYKLIETLINNEYPNLIKINKNFHSQIAADIILSLSVNKSESNITNDVLKKLILKSYNKNFAYYVNKRDNSTATEDYENSNSDMGIEEEEEEKNAQEIIEEYRLTRDEYKQEMGIYEFEAFNLKTEPEFKPTLLNLFNERGINILFRRARIKINLSKKKSNDE